MKNFIGVFIVVFSSFSFAGPIIVGGAGEGEYSVVFVHKNLQPLIGDCLEFGCELSAPQRSILESMSQSPMKNWTLVFKGQNDLSDLFRLLPARNEVWINRDLLWLDANRTRSYGVDEALRLWIQILGSQLNFDTNKVNEVARIAGESLRNQVQRGGVSLDDQQTFEFLLWQRGNEFRFLMRDPILQTLILSEFLNEKTLKCSSKLSNLQIYSPVWVPITSGKSENSLNVTLHFGISWTCEGRFFNTNALFYAEAIRENTTTPWSLKSSSLGVFINLEGYREFLSQVFGEIFVGIECSLCD